MISKHIYLKYIIMKIKTKQAQVGETRLCNAARHSRCSIRRDVMRTRVDPLLQCIRSSRDASCEDERRGEGCKDDSPQALQISLPSPSRRHCGVLATLQLAQCVAAALESGVFNREVDPPLREVLSMIGGEKRRGFPLEGRRLGWRWRGSWGKASRVGEWIGLSCILDIELMLFWWKFMTGDSRTTGDIL